MPETPGEVAADATGGTRISRLIGLVDGLARTVAGGTELLSCRRPRSLADTLAENERLAAAYEREIKAIKADPAWLRAADPGDKDQLKAAVERLDGVMAEHARQLVAVKSIAEGIIQAVAEEVQRKRQPATGYGRNALLGPAGGYGAARTTPLALNQTI